jgi:hypothetical protein
MSWGLIAGISSVALPLALCTACCCYRYVWSVCNEMPIRNSVVFVRNPSRTRREEQEGEETSRTQQASYLSLNTENTSRATSEISVGSQSEVTSTTHLTNGGPASGSLIESSLLVTMYNAAEGRRAGNASMLGVTKPNRNGNQLLGLLKRKTILANVR